MGRILCSEARTPDSWLYRLLESVKQRQAAGEVGSEFKVLELGSGTGLGGICMARLLEEVCDERTNALSDLTSTIVMSDVCAKALEVIQRNLANNGNLCKPERIQLKELEWGTHDSTWARDLQGSFDLVIASDVVYLPECVDPLLHSVKHFLKPVTGKCLLVNALVRTEAFLGQIDRTCDALGLNLQYCPDVVEEAQNKSKTFKVSLLDTK